MLGRDDSLEALSLTALERSHGLDDGAAQRLRTLRDRCDHERSRTMRCRCAVCGKVMEAKEAQSCV